MDRLEIKPSKLEGKINIPPSKSISHRAIIAASLANGISKIENISYSKDIKATLDGMKAMGVEVLEEILDKKTGTFTLKIKGIDKFKLYEKKINCKESGSTIRFLIPLFLLSREEFEITGEGRLIERPLDTYYNIFDKQGIKYKNTEGKLPLKIQGELKADVFEIEGDISSQFITGLLFTLPLLEKDSKILITKSKLESKGYVDLTIDILRDFGIEIVNNEYEEFIIKGNQRYKSRNYRVEGDYSQGAFWIVAGLIGKKISSCDLLKKSLQGDKEIVDIIKRMDGNLEIREQYIIASPSKTKGTIIDASQCPDIIPVLAVLASVSKGETKIVNGKRLRIKESDRIISTTTELKKLGADIKETEDGMIIQGKEILKGGVEIDSWNDHRIAMAMAIASIKCKKSIIIKAPNVVDKSYPNFWEDFKELGGIIS